MQNAFEASTEIKIFKQEFAQGATIDPGSRNEFPPEVAPQGCDLPQHSRFRKKRTDFLITADKGRPSAGKPLDKATTHRRFPTGYPTGHCNL